VFKLLIDYGAQQDYKDEDGGAVPTVARICEQTKIVEILAA
jgi:hypothetical protein